MMRAGFDILEGNHHIVPIMLYDARLAQDMADELLKEGVYVIGFYCRNSFQLVWDASFALTNFLAVLSSTTGVTTGKMTESDQLIIHDVNAS